MSQLNSKNFYEVLGVEKTSDERTIKKAYFTLVRKYPPETHPEEFKKIREAYEVLADANARQEYDSLGQYDQHGEEVSGKVREAMDAMEQERYGDAQAILATLLAAHPDLGFVKDLLGIAFLRSKQPEQALELFLALCEQHPDNAAYQLHAGYAHHALKQYPQAQEAYGRARAADKDDVRPLVSLADCFMDQRRWDDAVRTLDEAINLDGSVDFRDFALFLRKVEIEIERQRPDAMTAVLQALMPIIPDDPAARKVVANRLASLAAPLFAQKRVNEANLLMREAAKLDPNRGSGQMPTSFTVDIERLPDASKAWLTTQNNTRSFQKVNGSPYALAIFLLLLGLGLAFMPTLVLYTDDRGLEADAIFTMGFALTGGLLLTAYSVLRIIAAAKSPYGAYTFVHPMFLLDVKVDQLTAWPLANLHDVRITHRHTNGVYNGSGIDLVFATRTYSTNIYGKEQSVEWANHVLALRRRMLELMYSGMLEDASEETKLIPASLIPEEGKKQAPTERQLALKKRNRIVYAAALGLGVVMALIAVPVNLVHVDNRDYQSAQYAYEDKVGAFKSYLKEHPRGRHVDDAKKSIDALYDAAVAQAKKHPDAELGPALVDIITALKAKQATRVGVTYASSTPMLDKLDMAKLPVALQKNMVNPKGAFSDSANQSREQQISSSLQSAFGTALGSGLITLVPASTKDLQVTFDINYEVGLTGSIYESVKQPGTKSELSGDEKFFGIAFFWDFAVTFAGETEPRYTFKVASEPAKDIHWTTYGGSGYRSPTLPYDKMAESAFDDFKEGLALRFGVASAKPRNSYAEDTGDDGSDTGDDYVDPPPPPTTPTKKPQLKGPQKAPLPGKHR